jgi:hypothetical protein
MRNQRLAVWRRRPSCQDFAASVPATRGLIAAPWTPLASLCSAGGSNWSLSVAVHRRRRRHSLRPLACSRSGNEPPRFLVRRLHMNDSLRQALKKLRLSGLLQNLDEANAGR